MKLGIMQPYFFPYAGYWQLIKAVDRFVIYDDVNYIKGGWINRNRLLINGQPNYISVPLQHSSPYKKINEINLQHSDLWRKKLEKKIFLTYKKSPFFENIFPIIQRVIQYESNNLGDYLAFQIKVLSEFMGIKTEILLSSSHYTNNQLSGQARVIDICKKEFATTYINQIGGKDIYDATAFNQAGVSLCCIQMQAFSYQQGGATFVPNLSIIDVLMSLGVTTTKQYLDKFFLTELQNSSVKKVI